MELSGFSLKVSNNNKNMEEYFSFKRDILNSSHLNNITKKMAY